MFSMFNEVANMFYPYLLSIMLVMTFSIDIRHVLCKPKLINTDQSAKTSWDVATSDSNNKNPYHRSQQQQQPEWSVELIQEPPAPTSSIQLDVQYPVNSINQYESMQAAFNQTTPEINRDLNLVNKLSNNQNDLTLNKYFNKINQVETYPTKNYDYFTYQKSPHTTAGQYYINNTKKVNDDLYRLGSQERVQVDFNSQPQKDLPFQFKRSMNYAPIASKRNQNYYNDDIIKLINEHNKALSQKFMTELAMTLPQRTSLSELIWLSDQVQPSYTYRQPYVAQQQVAYPFVDIPTIVSNPILFGNKQNKANFRSWDDYTNYQNNRLHNRFGNINRAKTSRVDGDLAISLDTNDENVKYHIFEDYSPNYGDAKPFVKQRKREDDTNLMMQGSHFSNHYEPAYLAPPIHHFKGPSKKSGLEKAGFSVLIGSIAALISFLIISNIFLSIPLFAITLMQLIQPNNNQIIPIPNTNPNQQVIPNNQSGKRRKKRDLNLSSLGLSEQNEANLDKLFLDLSMIIESFNHLQQSTNS